MARYGSELIVRRFHCDMAYVASYIADPPRMADVPLFDKTRRPYWGRVAGGESDISDPGLAPSLFCGEWIPNELLERFPAEISVVRPNPRGKSRAEIRQDVLGGNIYVSDACRSVIEAVEPNRHQFIPVAIEALSGVRHRFNYFNCLNWVPTADLFELSKAPMPGVEQRRMVITRYVETYPIWRVADAARPPVRKQHFENAVIVIEGAEALSQRPTAIGGRRYYCRDKFFHECKRAGLRGFRFSEPFPLI